MNSSLDEQTDNLEFMTQMPDDIDSLMAYGDNNLKMGRKLLALSAYQKILDINPDNVLSRNKVTSIFIKQKMLNDAYREILFSLEKEPANLEARFLLFILQKELPSTAEDITERLNKLDKFYPVLEEIYSSKERLIKEKEELDNQIKSFQEKLNSFPDDLCLEFELQMHLKNKSDIEAFLTFIDDIEKEEEKLKEEKERFKQEEEERLRQEEEERLRQEEEERLRQEEEERLKQEEEERLKQEEEERLKQEEEERLKQEEEERLKQEEEEKLKQEEEERLRKEEENEKKQQIFIKLGEVFGTKLDDFASHKMIAGVLLADVSGMIVKSSTVKSFSSDKIGSIVAEGVSVFKAFKSMDYWVSEYQQGLIFVKLIARDLILVVNGGADSNLGALKFVIDRNEKELIATLRSSEFASLLSDI